MISSPPVEERTRIQAAIVMIEKALRLLEHTDAPAVTLLRIRETVPVLQEFARPRSQAES